MNFLSCTVSRFFSCVPPLIIPCKNFFTKLIFHSCVPPLICIWKKVFTKLNFRSCVPHWYSLNFLLILRLRLILRFWEIQFGCCILFYFAEKSLSWEIQFERCAHGFWCHILFYTLLTSELGLLKNCDTGTLLFKYWWDL